MEFIPFDAGNIGSVTSFERDGFLCRMTVFGARRGRFRSASKPGRLLVRAWGLHPLLRAEIFVALASWRRDRIFSGRGHYQGDHAPARSGHSQQRRLDDELRGDELSRPGGGFLHPFDAVRVSLKAQARPAPLEGGLAWQ